MAKKKKVKGVPKILIVACVVFGITTLVLGILNRKFQLLVFSEIAGYTGTFFVASLVIVIGIMMIQYVRKN